MTIQALFLFGFLTVQEAQANSSTEAPASTASHRSTSNRRTPDMNAASIAPALQSLLASQDIMAWTKTQAADWVVSIPQLAHMREPFVANNIDGRALLRLSDKKMLQNLKLASPIDRRLLLQHIADLKAIQVRFHGSKALIAANPL